MSVFWPETPLGGVFGYCVVFSLLSGVIIAGAQYAAQARPSWRQAGLLVLGGVVLLLAASRLPDPHAALWAGAGLLGAALILGARLGAEVHQAAHLWPLALVALGADVWSVTTPEGVTNQVVESGPEGVLNYVILSLPVPGVGLSPVLGVGDVIFTALLMGAVVHLRLSTQRVIIGLSIGFSLCLMGLLIIQLPIPALPFLAFGGVAALGRQAKPNPKELLAALVFVAGFFLVRAVLV